MQLAFITPTSYLEHYSAQGDFYLALAHLVDDEGTNEYAQFHLKQSRRGRRLYLDNGLFEGSQVSTGELLRRATAIQADVVCAPDVLYDAKGTIKAFKQFIRAKQDAGIVAQVMGIPQADNPEEWWECFQFMQNSNDCDMIGLSILSIPKSFGRLYETHVNVLSRVHVIQQLHYMQEFSGVEFKPMHLLGLGDSYADIFMANRLLPETIVSNDSSSCFVHGAQRIVYDKFGMVPGGKDPKKLNFNMAKTSHPLAIDHSSIQRNINIAQKAKSCTSGVELAERLRNG